MFFGLQVGYLWHFLPCLKIQDFQIKVEMKKKKVRDKNADNGAQVIMQILPEMGEIRRKICKGKMRRNKD